MRIKIRVTSDVENFRNQMVMGARITLPAELEKEAPIALQTIVNATRKYIPAEHRRAPGQREDSQSTGRLYSSFGVAVIRTNNPDFDPNDAVSKIFHRKGRSLRWHIEAGTRVDYADNANFGIPSVSNGYTKTNAYHFIQKGRIDSEKILKLRYEQATEEAVQKAIDRRAKYKIKRNPKLQTRELRDGEIFEYPI